MRVYNVHYPTLYIIILLLLFCRREVAIHNDTGRVTITRNLLRSSICQDNYGTRDNA